MRKKPKMFGKRGQLMIDGDPVLPIYFTQEVADLSTDNIKAAETLLRFQGESGKIYHFSRLTDQPDVLELHSVSRPLFQAAKIKITQHLFEKGYKYIGFNISLSQLFDDAWLVGIQELCFLASQKYRDHRIVFEIIEQDLPESHEDKDVEAALLMLRGVGAQFAIDDFGKSGSSLLRLCRLRPEYVKLDRDLVTMISDNAFSKKLISSIVRICQDNEIAVIAEGVETEAMSQSWRDIDVLLQQGYFFDRPCLRS